MKDHLTDEELALYAEFLQKNNNVEVPLNIIEHIKNCDKCASKSVELSFISDEITKELQFETEEKKEIRTVFFSKKIIVSVAATIFLFLSVWQIFGFFKEKNKIYSAQKITLLSKNIKNKKEIIKPIKKEDNKQEDNKLLSCYEENKEAEQLIDNFYANSRGEDIEVISPQEINFKNNKEITLEWKNAENIKLTIEIYNNKMIELETTETSKNYYVVENLSKGLYYWKLLNSDFDLLFLGKFYVR